MTLSMKRVTGSWCSNFLYKGMSDVTLEKLVSLCKRRGFIYPGSELYGGLAGTFDYGPLGVALKNNLKQMWWKQYVDDRDDMFGLDSAILMNSSVWEASGHTDVFNDPIVDDTTTGARYRADHLLEDNGIENAEALSLQQMTDLIKEKGIKSPEGNPLSDVRTFNMMFATRVGARDSDDATTYLRPETAQGMFVNFKNVVDSFYPDLPFGLAQAGRNFRNEISPREFIFRTREFEIMELEYFVREEDWEKYFEMWRNEFFIWAENIGLDAKKIHELDVPSEELAHYSKRTIDFEYEFSFGTKEIGAVAYRTDFDLRNHSKHSGVDLSYMDKHTNERFIPHVIEPTFGLDRNLFAVLAESYREESLEESNEKRVYLSFKKEVAPVRVAVFPLLKNKPALVEKAREVFSSLKKQYGRVVFDDNGNIGKRYRRQDEIGTPHCVTIDFDTLDDNTVTVRDRDTGKQDRVALKELTQALS